jgi:hypothetical protein
MKEHTMLKHVTDLAKTTTSKVAHAPKAAYTKAAVARARHQEKVAWARHEAMQDLMDETG